MTRESNMYDVLYERQNCDEQKLVFYFMYIHVVIVLSCHPSFIKTFFALRSIIFILINILYDNVQWNNIYPEWRDKLQISPVEHLSDLLLISLKDATKIGESEIIGQCILPLSKLLDQQAHTFWINLEPPSGMLKKSLDFFFELLFCFLMVLTDSFIYYTRYA